MLTLQTSICILILFEFSFTCQNRQPSHCGERVVSRRVQNVQLIHIPADAVKLSVKVLNGRCVLVVKTLI